MPKVCGRCSYSRIKKEATLLSYPTQQNDKPTALVHSHVVSQKWHRHSFVPIAPSMLDEPGMRLCSLCKVSLESLRE